jgi:hypothetical protein
MASSVTATGVCMAALGEDACRHPLQVCRHLHGTVGLRRRRQDQRPPASQLADLVSKLMTHARAKPDTNCGTPGVKTGLKIRHPSSKAPNCLLSFAGLALSNTRNWVS